MTPEPNTSAPMTCWWTDHNGVDYLAEKVARLLTMLRDRDAPLANEAVDALVRYYKFDGGEEALARHERELSGYIEGSVECDDKVEMRAVERESNDSFIRLLRVGRALSISAAKEGG